MVFSKETIEKTTIYKYMKKCYYVENIVSYTLATYVVT